MSRAEVVEKALGLTLPKDHVRFLKDYGCQEWDGVEADGYDDKDLDVDKFPNDHAP